MVGYIAWTAASLVGVLLLGSTHREQPAALENAPVLQRLPLHFEPNLGQSASHAKFFARGAGHAVALGPAEATFTLRHPSASAGAARSSRATVRMSFVDANPAAAMAGIDPLPGRANYFIGRDPARWRRNIPTYAKVGTRALYAGIDLLFYGSSQQELEYDLLVSPGADPGRIRLRFDGADRLTLTPDGDLLVHVARAPAGPGGTGRTSEPGETIRQRKPVIYQEIDGTRRPIDGRYLLADRHLVAFAIGDYDRARPLVIDPVLEFSSYLGGSRVDIPHRILVDAAGNMHLTGETTSLDFPTANATPLPGGNDLNDVFVTKINAAGTALVYSTYFGGSQNDVGFGLAFAPGGLIVGGGTDSPDFPTTAAFQPTLRGLFDGFVVLLDTNGDRLVYSTYLGGTGFDVVRAVASDAAGNAYVGGDTFSRDFPTRRPFQPVRHGDVDGFVAKLDPAGAALVYASYLGGNESTGEVVFSLAVGPSGRAYVAGTTDARNFRRHRAVQQRYGGGEFDAFVAGIEADGASLVFSTYLGGSALDRGVSVALGPGERATVTGSTDSIDFPTRLPLQATSGGSTDAFVAQYTPDGASLLFSTFLGGSGIEFGNGVAVDPAGGVHVTGSTSSADFPVVDAVQPVFGGAGPFATDAFACKLAPDGGAFQYSTYLGGSSNEEGVSVATDASGSSYLTGITSSDDFPLVNPLQAARTGPLTFFNVDGYFAKIR